MRDSIHQLGNTNIGLHCCAEDGNQCPRDDGFDDGSFDLFRGKLLPFEIAHHEVFVCFHCGVENLLVRRAAPQGNLGKTFGTVYSGLDGGSLLGPLLIGPVLDHGAPQLLFVIAAIGFCLATFAVRGIRRPAPLAAA